MVQVRFSIGGTGCTTWLRAICRRVYPGRDDSPGIRLFSKGGQSDVCAVTAREMMPSNPY